MFSRLGVLNTIVSDNGTMFTGSEFKVYCDSLAIEHITPTYNPRSNGQAEKFVDTFKRALKNAKGFDTEEKNIQTFLMAYRIRPRDISMPLIKEAKPNHFLSLWYGPIFFSCFLLCFILNLRSVGRSKSAN